MVGSAQKRGIMDLIRRDAMELVDPFSISCFSTVDFPEKKAKFFAVLLKHQEQETVWIIALKLQTVFIRELFVGDVFNKGNLASISM